MGLTSHTSLAPTIERFWQGTDKDSKSSIGAYFERPGRTVLERLLTDVPAPKDVLGNESGLEDFSRVFLVSESSHHFWPLQVLLALSRSVTRKG
jgi:hypothetical protein